MSLYSNHFAYLYTLYIGFGITHYSTGPGWDFLCQLWSSCFGWTYYQPGQRKHREFGYGPCAVRKYFLNCQRAWCGPTLCIFQGFLSTGKTKKMWISFSVFPVRKTVKMIDYRTKRWQKPGKNISDDKIYDVNNYISKERKFAAIFFNDTMCHGTISCLYLMKLISSIFIHMIVV